MSELDDLIVAARGDREPVAVPSREQVARVVAQFSTAVSEVVPPLVIPTISAIRSRWAKVQSPTIDELEHVKAEFRAAAPVGGVRRAVQPVGVAVPDFVAPRLTVALSAGVTLIDRRLDYSVLGRALTRFWRWGTEKAESRNERSSEAQGARSRTWLEPTALRGARRGAALLAKLGIHPYVVTGTAVAFAGLSGAFFIANRLLLAAVALTCSGVAEFVDGASAQEAASPRRAVFIDYVADRVSDILIFGGIALAYSDQNSVIAWTSGAILICALTSSYARAEAIALRLSAPKSMFGRAERLIPIVAGAWLAWAAFPIGSMQASLFIAGGFTAATLVERVLSSVRAPAEDLENAEWVRNEFLPRLQETIREAQEAQRPKLLIAAPNDETGSATVLGIVDPCEGGAVVYPFPRDERPTAPPAPRAADGSQSE